MRQQMKAGVVHAVLGWLYILSVTATRWTSVWNAVCRVSQVQKAKLSVELKLYLCWLEYSFNYTAVFRMNKSLSLSLSPYLSLFFLSLSLSLSLFSHSIYLHGPVVINAAFFCDFYHFWAQISKLSYGVNGNIVFHPYISESVGTWYILSLKTMCDTISWF